MGDFNSTMSGREALRDPLDLNATPDVEDSHRGQLLRLVMESLSVIYFFYE